MEGSSSIDPSSTSATSAVSPAVSSAATKVIKEETIEESPCSPGKENRRSPGLNSSSTEILTRSRSKVLTKENSQSNHHRLSESPNGNKGPTTSAFRSQSSPIPGKQGSSTPTGHHHEFVTQFSNGSTSIVRTSISGEKCPNSNSSSSKRSQVSTCVSSNSPYSSASIYSAENLNHMSASARHIIKIKRFLGTLLHFGLDISTEVGERVRSLVFNLVSGHLSIEEFHHSLQEVTSFPLRPFVLPFLRAHLPLLQRETSHLARLAKQTTLSYIRTHESAIIDAPSGEPCDIFHSDVTDLTIHGKRKAPESFYENGDESVSSGVSSGYTSTPKRHNANIFSPSFFQIAPSCVPSSITDLREYYSLQYPAIVNPHHTHSIHHETTPISQSASSTSASSNNCSSTNSSSNNNSANSTNKNGPPEDEWKNIHVMLNCILSMVEKTKRALGILQTRSLASHSDSNSSENVGSSSSSPQWLRRQNYSSFPVVAVDSEDFKRQAGDYIPKFPGDMINAALKATEDRVAEVKRRAEEAVQEVKRQALVELQRAVAAAERMIVDSRRGGGGPTNSVIIGTSMDSEACWNCGRKANETCSGCNMARYCSSFCQHKDWENHHSVCGRSSSNSERISNSGENLRKEKNSGHQPQHTENSNSSPINVSNPSPDNQSSGSN